MSTTFRSPRRAVRGFALSLAALLLLAGPVHAQTPTDDPAEAAAGWLVSVLTDDPALDTGFGPSPGPTIDVLLALSAVGVASGSINDIAGWLESQAASYTQEGPSDDLPDGGVYAGATAKLALAMLVVGRDPGATGGIDLIEQLLGREVDDPAEGIVGRFSDQSQWGDFTSPLTQSLALLALQRADGVTPSPAAVAALTDQACPNGGFPTTFAADPCVSSVDTTGYAVQALVAVGEDAAAEAAASWLASVQADDGSFASPDGVNTNSTGLAAAALASTERTAAATAAIAWIGTQQDGCDTGTPGAIPFNQSERGSVELATAQATFGMSGASLATVSSAGARAEVPQLDCAPPTEPEPTPADPEPVTEDDGVSGTGESADGSSEDEVADMPRPTQVEAGLSPSRPAAAFLTAALGALLLAFGLTAGLHVRSTRR